MDKNKIIKDAFRLACRYLREHPPMDVCDDIEITVKCVIGGSVNDPEGARWMTYFIEKAIEKEKEYDRENENFESST